MNLKHRLEWVWPNYCVLCHIKTNTALALCATCISELPWHTGLQCAICAVSLCHGTICGSCLKTKPAFEHVISPFRYEFPADLFISRMKFNKKLLYAHILGHLLATHLQQLPHHTRPEAIICIPLHAKRLRERGFNQSAEIGKIVSKSMHIPLDQRILIRHQHTAAQTTLSASERMANMKDAFSITRPIPYRHIALLDDVITTGATIQQASNVLKKQGVQHITVWCAARTVE